MKTDLILKLKQNLFSKVIWWSTFKTSGYFWREFLEVGKSEAIYAKIKEQMKTSDPELWPQNIPESLLV